MTRDNGVIEFANEDLTGSRFQRVNLTGSQFWLAQLNGAEFRGCEFADTRFRIVEMSGVTMQGVELHNVDISGDNGTVARACRLEPVLLHEPVDGEWSFIETLRHLVLVTDGWIRRAVLADPSPWHPLDLPWDDPDETRSLPAGIHLFEEWEHRLYSERDLDVLEANHPSRLNGQRSSSYRDDWRCPVECSAAGTNGR